MCPHRPIKESKTIRIYQSTELGSTLKAWASLTLLQARALCFPHSILQMVVYPTPETADNFRRLIPARFRNSFNGIRT
jgi:hypothetical protein